MLIELFKIEVPEISEGVIQIRAAAVIRVRARRLQLKPATSVSTRWCLCRYAWLARAGSLQRAG